jgi:hypothetical protein
MMRVSKYFLFALSILLLNLETLDAATILGKVAIYFPPSNTDSGIRTYPLVSGNKMNFDYKAAIKIVGGTIVADKGTVLQAFDKGEQIAFQVDKGTIYFRILPSKIRVSFKTPHGEVSSPKVAQASNSTITGKIVVADKDSTVEIDEGTLEVIGSNGSVTSEINAGEGIQLAQAEVDEPAPATLEELIGRNGVTQTSCTPECTIKIEEKPRKDGGEPCILFLGKKVWDGVVVDSNFQPIGAFKDDPLRKGTKLHVVGVKGSTLLVQPYKEDRCTAMKTALAAALLETFGAICGTTFCRGGEENNERGASAAQ